MLNRSSSSPVTTGPLKGLNGPEPECQFFPPLELRIIIGDTAVLVCVAVTADEVMERLEVWEDRDDEAATE